MTTKAIAYFTLLTLLLGCAHNDRASSKVGIPVQRIAPKRSKQDDLAIEAPLTFRQREILQPFLGLSESEARSLAEAQGREFRVSARNSESLPLTADFILGRITAVINDGVVTSCDIEGTDLSKNNLQK